VPVFEALIGKEKFQPFAKEKNMRTRALRLAALSLAYTVASLAQTTPPSGAPPASNDPCAAKYPGGGGQLYPRPLSNGMAIDHCYHYGTNCDQDAADQVCQQLNSATTHATSCPWSHQSPTWVVGDAVPCTATYCVGFVSLTCK
jgi:hypothetical protein